MAEYLLSADERMNTHLRIIRDPTIVNAPPVAHGGNEEKMGAKKIEMKNMIPVVIAVNPVLPPSTATISKVIYSRCLVDGLVPLIPVADSMHTLTGLVPNREPRT